MRRPAQLRRQKKALPVNAHCSRLARCPPQRRKPDPAAPGCVHSADNVGQAIGSAPAPARQVSKIRRWSAMVPCLGGQKSSYPPPWPRNEQAASADSASASASSPGRKSAAKPAARQKAWPHPGRAGKAPDRWGYTTKWVRPALSDHNVPSKGEARAGWASAFAKR